MTHALALALLVGRDAMIGARTGCRVADTADTAGVLWVDTARFGGIVDFGLRVDVVVVGAKRALGSAAPGLLGATPDAGLLEGFEAVIADLAGRRKIGSSISSLA
jgi:hypothetical protein